MQGVIEALFWVNLCVEHGILNPEDDVLFTVDSLYVKGLIDDKFIAREKRVSACHVAGPHVESDKKRLRLHIHWIRGHSGDVEIWHCRSPGRRGYTELQHRWWRR